MIGVVLQGTYRIERAIGAGGMGEVYLATHVRLPDKRYAVKLLRNKPNESQLVRFRREAEIATKLGHPHIVDVHDFNAAPDGTPYLVMELLDGEDLAHRLDRVGGLPVPQVRRIVGEIAAALDAAHAIGVVHRDLKPHNVFLCRRPDRDDFVKLLDFGISKVRDAAVSLTGEASLVGTVPYMSPEQARGDTELDARSDVFALGAITWEILTGRMAFPGDNVMAVLGAVMSVEPPPVHTVRRELAPAVSEAIARALAKDRNVRTPTAGQFARELDAGLVMPAAWTPTQPGPSAQPRRKRWPFVVGGVAVVGAIATAAVLAGGGDPGRAPAIPVDAGPRVVLDNSCRAILAHLDTMLDGGISDGSDKVMAACQTWSEEVRTCLATAADLAAATLCEGTHIRGPIAVRVARICDGRDGAVDKCVEAMARALDGCATPDAFLDCVEHGHELDRCDCVGTPVDATPGDPCDTVADNILRIGRSMNVPELSTDHEKLARDCRDQLSDDDRRCMAAATTLAGLEVCDHHGIPPDARAEVVALCDGMPAQTGESKPADVVHDCVIGLDQLLPKCAKPAVLIDCYRHVQNWNERALCEGACGE